MSTWRQEILCPDCSRTVFFENAATNVIVCNCGTVLQRREGDQIVSRAYPVILEKNDMIMVGTTGEWKGRSFKVLGRLRIWFSDSVINYWTIAFTDGSLQYLSEGYGMFALLERTLTDRVIDGARL